ncbi:alpha/beta-hydrolase [Mucor ambiguus]|uniref:Alpha/beta-hydrolase n=1 Tax=Mucor ambiguus TaxID=91626 RepID=A0A0C9M3G7_9FUNG|nr:alpha/beta-hydrolase [Mucor ambiguus]
MVSTSYLISQGLHLCVAVSCLLIHVTDAASSNAHKDAKNEVSKPSSSSSSNATLFEGLPPLIPDRVIPARKPRNAGKSYDVETPNIERNVQWYNEHNPDQQYNLTRRSDAALDADTVGGYTLDLPENAPPIQPSSDDVMIQATTSQINDFKKYSAIAGTAYCRNVVPKSEWNCVSCLQYVPDGKIIKTFTSFASDTNGFLLRSDKGKTLYLVFRGTSSFRNAITDLKFDKVAYPNVKGARVHKGKCISYRRLSDELTLKLGFLASYNEIISSYFPAIQEQLTAFPNYNIIITGHSLGGAQAVLAGMDLYQRDHRISSKNLKIFSNGMPRIGSPEFAYYVDSTKIPLYRSVNERDIVPHLPPQSFGFLHPGVEAWIKSPGSVYICSKEREMIIQTTTIQIKATAFLRDDSNQTLVRLSRI